MSPARPSQLAVLATLLWPLFLVCSGLVALVWTTGFGPGVIADPDFARKVPNADLRAALVVFAQALDPAWITLGAVNVYLALVRAEGIGVARRWCGMLLAAGFGIAAVSAAAGFPLGPVHYPQNLGMKLGPVPFALPFLWVLVVAGARETVLRACPRLGHGWCAALAGIGCAATSLLLDPLAWKVRAWWLWYPAQLDAPGTAPWSAPLTWLVAGGALAFLMRSPRVAPRMAVRPVAPMAAYLILNAVAVLVRVIL